MSPRQLWRAAMATRVYVITDSRLRPDRSHRETAAAAFRSGVRVVQYREKEATTRQMLEDVRALVELAEPYQALVLVNDRVDVARAAGAHGVHVGDEDMPVGLAREWLGPDAVIGVSAVSEAEVDQALADGADYVGVGPVFPTGTKPAAGAAIGTAEIARVAARRVLPVVAIGGVGAQNAAEVIRAGADMVAVISAVVCAADMAAAAADLMHRCEAVPR